ncbi:MAG: hypothetical protein VX733_02440 [Candidatus Latescibacterota bacterium]|nr:hypothetical protein [Candidatus Latescibacterota bacterium]
MLKTGTPNKSIPTLKSGGAGTGASSAVGGLMCAEQKVDDEQKRRANVGTKLASEACFL